MKKKAYIYCRVASPENVHFHLTRQEQQLREYAEKQGFEIVGLAAECGSSTRINRELEKILSSQTQYDVLLCQDISRLGRSMPVLHKVLTKLFSRGAWCQDIQSQKYRFMSKPENRKLSEDERLELALDLAYDLDEFFRQKEPRYAPAHPDSHARKGWIADLLLDGKTAALKNTLPDMNSELTMRIQRYEEVAGQDTFDVVPENFKTGEKITTPRGSFSLTDMTKEQMRDAGYGYHHSSDDGRYHIMGNGTQAFAVRNHTARTYEIYQLKDYPGRHDYAFEPLDRIHKRGLKVDIRNYEKVYAGAMRPGENPESIYTRFNTNRPKDFTGHSLSVSDVVVLHQNGQAAAYYCDSFGFAEIPEFFVPDHMGKSAKTNRAKEKNEPEI